MSSFSTAANGPLKVFTHLSQLFVTQSPVILEAKRKLLNAPIAGFR